jgi:beta-fructofuranosidase
MEHDAEEEKAMDAFFKPESGAAADFIPFYRDGIFYLFYLRDYRDVERHGEGTPWELVTTKDFVDFTKHGEVLARGTRAEQDLYVFTGSVIEARGAFHIFYTGCNPYLKRIGQAEQAVLHAVSQDLLVWEKDPDFCFKSPCGRFELHDWRDPFVFYNDQEHRYWMLLAARLSEGPSRRRGITALCTSDDLIEWKVEEPLYAPNRYYTHECPDLFRMGGFYYLLFSEFTDGFQTRYRYSRSPNGPWMTPKNDTFDTRVHYAAKTVFDGKARYLFGWNATRTNEQDHGSWMWGGTLVVHEISQGPDGTLLVNVPESVDRAFHFKKELQIEKTLGCCEVADGVLSLGNGSSYASLVFGVETGPVFKYEVDLKFEEGTDSCGLLLRSDEFMEKGYSIRLEPKRSRLVLDRWPREGDVPYVPGMERAIDLKPRVRHQLKVFVEQSLCEVYLDDRVAMSTRIYDLKEGRLGLFTSSGHVGFTASLYVRETGRVFSGYS